MYLKLNNQRLYLGQLIETVQKDKSERTTFPYTSEVSRCRYQKNADYREPCGIYAVPRSRGMPQEWSVYR